MANILPPVEFATITGRFMVAGNDSDDPGAEADIVPAKGKGSIIPSVGHVLVAGATPPATVKLATVYFEIDSEGYICDAETKERNVEVIAPSEAVNPSAFTYRINFDGGLFPGFDFYVVPGSTIDLTDVGRVATSVGVATTRGEPGVGIESMTLSPDQSSLVVIYDNLSEQTVEIPALGEIAQQAQATTDEVIATALADPNSATRAAGNATYAPESGSPKYVGVQKVENGAVVPGRVRQPTLTVERAWPDRNVDYHIVWYADGGQTLYGVGTDYTVRKSTDGGVSWAVRGRLPYTADRAWPSSVFLKLASGTLITYNPFHSGIAATIYRSTDDGATWTAVHTGPVGQHPMGPQGWAVDPQTGHVYYGEYHATLDATETEVRVYRSTDDGVTWPVFHTLPGPASGAPAGERVRHVHSITHDHVTGRMIVATGDSTGASGLYQTNAAGTGLEPLMLNRDAPIPGGEGARAIGVIPFPDYIVYMGDASSNPYIMRVKRGPNATVLPETTERLYRVNSTGWWAIKASADGSRWVVSASPENSSIRLDSSSHLYAVEDQGDTITEVGAISSRAAAAGFLALAPVGNAAEGGDVFMLTAQGVARNAQWLCRLARGTTAVPWPEQRPRAYAWQTQNSGVMTFTAGESVQVFGGTKAPAKGFRYLRIYDCGVKLLSGTGPATLYVRAGSILLNINHATHGLSYRSFLGGEAGSAECLSFVIPEGQEVTFELRNNAASTIVGYVTYGWGN